MITLFSYFIVCMIRGIGSNSIQLLYSVFVSLKATEPISSLRFLRPYFGTLYPRICAMATKPIMDSELRTLLATTFHLEDETVGWLESLGCTSVALLAVWANDVNAVDELAKRGPKKEIESEAPKLKAAWSRAKALAERCHKREAEG
jgi:hypothetical protein